MNVDQKWRVEWNNGGKTGYGKTLIQAVKKMRFGKKRIIVVGMLVKVGHKGITSYWDSKQFIKHANLVIVK